MARQDDDRDIMLVLAVYALIGLGVLGFWGFVLYLAWRLVEYVTR